MWERTLSIPPNWHPVLSADISPVHSVPSSKAVVLRCRAEQTLQFIPHTSHSSTRKTLPASFQVYSGRWNPCIKACMPGRWIHRYHRPVCQDGTLTFVFQGCSPLTFSQKFYSTKGGTANVWGHTADTYVGSWYSSVHTWGLFLLFFEINFSIVKFQSPNI